MEKATLTISLPRPMKDFIAKKVQGGRFSTPSEYIRSLIRGDQDQVKSREVAPPRKSTVPGETEAGSRRPRRK